jgi:hypothetical protein
VRKVEPQIQLANYYLALCYSLWARYEWLGINLNYAGIQRVMERLALGIPLRWQRDGEAPKDMEERLAQHLTWLVVSRGRKVEDSVVKDLRVEAAAFVAKHRELFAEIKLAGASKDLNKELAETGSRV